MDLSEFYIKIDQSSKGSKHVLAILIFRSLNLNEAV